MSTELETKHEMTSDPAVASSGWLGEAMQLVWNDWCGDTGCVPDCIRIHGPRTTRVVGDFMHSNFTFQVVQTLKAMGYSITPNVKVERQG